MSKKKNEDKKEEANDAKRPVWPFIVGLLLCGFAIFLLIAFLSYCFTWQQDQSAVRVSAPQAGNNIYNKSGRFGLLIADKWIGTFGLGALVLPLIIFLIGLRFLRPNYGNFIKNFFALIGGLILLSLIPAFLTYPFKFAQTLLGYGLGGTHGRYSIEWMINNLGGIGATLLLAFIIILYSLFLTPKTIDVLKNTYLLGIQYVERLWLRIKNLFNRLIGQGGKQVATFAIGKPVKKNTREDELPLEKDFEITVRENTVQSNLTETIPGDDDFIIIRTNDEDAALDAADVVEEQKDPLFLPPVDLENTEEIEEIYLPEHMLVGELYDPTRDLSGYNRPPIDLLEDYKNNDDKIDTAELSKNKDKIVQILGNYKIGIEKIFATVGPTVTLYEIVPKDGVRISQIKRLEDDIALRIAALGVRIIAPIPGKGTVGIEVPNEKPGIVAMRAIIKSAKFQDSNFELPVALGKTILGEVFAFDLAKMPHLLVAGATGQGKSVGLNAILTSLLYKKHPAELKIVMVDPKKVELAPYSKIAKHFLAKLPDEEEAIITDTQKVVYTLKSLCIEMDNRYDLLKMAGVRNVKEYNFKFVNRRLNPLKGHYYMPYIVLVIDEFADLIMTAGREIEEPIARLAQLARAIGIHLVIATQRPTTNIITGLIKANFPARIAFRVTSMIDSRTILDTPGANQLIGRGDMLVSTGAELIRVQCAFVDTPEVDRITDFIRTQPGYGATYDLPEYVGEDGKDGAKQVDMKNLDDMFEDAAKLIVQHQQGSTSLIQRKLSLGYNRAGRIMDQLEAAGIVGPAEGSKARQVFISDFASLDSILTAFRK